MKYSIACLFLVLVTASAVSFAENPQPQAIGIPPPYKAVFTKATHTRGIDAPNGQLIDAISQLAQRASAGDGHAAAQIYAGLSACKSFKDRQSPDFGSQCTGITDEDLANKGKWLAIAASLGDEEAQYAYAVGGFDDIVGVQDPQKHPDVFKSYQSKSREYLLGMADRCNFDAIAAIGLSGGSGGLIFGADAATAYTFQLIKEQLANRIFEEDMRNRAHMESVLSGAVIASDQRAASEFVLDHCM